MQKHVENYQILTYSILETGSEWKYNFPNWKGRHGQSGPLHFPKLNGTVRDKFAKVSWKPKCQQCSRKAKFEKVRKEVQCVLSDGRGELKKAWQENKNTEKYTAPTPDTGWTICGILCISAPHVRTSIWLEKNKVQEHLKIWPTLYNNDLRSLLVGVSSLSYAALDEISLMRWVVLNCHFTGLVSCGKAKKLSAVYNMKKHQLTFPEPKPFTWSHYLYPPILGCQDGRLHPRREYISVQKCFCCLWIQEHWADKSETTWRGDEVSNNLVQMKYFCFETHYLILLGILDRIRARLSCK